MSIEVSVIFTTYNAPVWLEKVLWGFSAQNYLNFEIIIADDGSGPETESVIQKVKNDSQLSIQHVWQEDNGFQKCQILNKAIEASRGEYLIFTDGDCVPRSDFIAEHVKHRLDRYFLSGGYSKLSLEASQALTKEEIISGRAFDPDFLHRLGLRNRFGAKHSAKGWQVPVFNFLTPTQPTWNGHNASTWKRHALEINGFDERMHYGGEDREFGERLFNLGLKSKQIRYSAICLHLEHERGYKSKEGIAYNKSIRSNTRDSGNYWAEDGIVKSEKPAKHRPIE
jgi:glycosyltransferase involved in cell wall biosynthesis